MAAAARWARTTWQQNTGFGGATWPATNKATQRVPALSRAIRRGPVPSGNVTVFVAFMVRVSRQET